MNTDTIKMWIISILKDMDRNTKSNSLRTKRPVDVNMQDCHRGENSSNTDAKRDL